MTPPARWIWAAAVASVVFAVGSTACDDDTERPPPFTTSSITSTTRLTTTTTVPPTTVTSEVVVDTTAPPSPWMQGPYVVTRIVDGDTIDVSEVGRVRLIGIDTPEVYGGKECFGEAASVQMNTYVGGKQVYLEYDPSQGLADRYDRTLAYVWRDGVNINRSMILAGAAREYLYDEPYRYYREFVAAEQEAQTHGMGLWGAC